MKFVAFLLTIEAFLQVASATGGDAASLVSTLANPPRGSIAMPTAVARDKAGALLVADADSGTVYRIGGGTATAIVAPKTFATPTAILVSDKHGLLVSDANGACIYRIEAALATPMFGHCGSPGSIDGTSASAMFKHPMDLAEDADGVIYVADFGVGVRRIGLDGNVTTILPETGSDVVGVAWGQDEKGAALFVGSESKLSLCNPQAGHCDYSIASTPLPTKRTGSEGDRPAGLAYHIAAFSSRDALYTDPRNHRIRYIHFYQIVPAAGSFADDQESEAAGFADGIGTTAKFNTPLGITRDRDGSFLVADAGNHAIRRVAAPVRIVETPVGLDFVKRFPTSANTYRIAVLGTSLVWWNTERADSIGGRIEAGIKHDAKKDVRVFPAVFPGAKLDSLVSVANEELSEGSANAIALEVDTSEVADDIESDAWQGPFLHTLIGLRDSLAAKHVKLALFTIPFPAETNLSESFALQLLGGGPSTKGQPAVYQRLVDVARAAKIPFYDSRPSMLASEQSADHAPLFESVDEHLSAYGRENVANGLRKFLERTWFASRDATF